MRFLIFLTACAPDLRELNRFRIVGEEFAEGVNVITQDNGDGSLSAQVKATDKVAWVYVDLQTGAEVTEADAWDLAFQRFNVRVQGEISEALDDWYDYNLNNHTLVAKKTIYTLTTVEGDAYSIEMLNYYDSTGTSGFPAFRYAPL